MKKWPTRECRLPECKRRFRPHREWQEFCRPDHQQKFQKRIRRIAAALAKYAGPIEANANALPLLVKTMDKAADRAIEIGRTLRDMADVVGRLLPFTEKIAEAARQAKDPDPGREAPAPGGKPKAGQTEKGDTHVEASIAGRGQLVNPPKKGEHQHG